MAAFQRLQTRQVLVSLPFSRFLHGENHELFTRFHGRVKIRQAVGPRGGLKPRITITSSISYPQCLYCNPEIWPLNTPAEIFFLFQCREHQIKHWISADLDIANLLHTGLAAFIEAKISLILGTYTVKYRSFLATHSSAKRKEIFCLRDRSNFLTTSENFSKFIDTGVLTQDLRDATLSDLEALLPKNTAFKANLYSKLYIPAGCTFKIIQCKERELLGEILKFGYRAEALKIAKTSKPLNEPTIPSSNDSHFSITQREESDSIESDHSILSDVFGDLSGDGVNELVNTFSRKNTKVIREMGIAYADVSETDTFQRDYDVHAVTRKMALQNFSRANYFYIEGDLEVPALAEIKDYDYAKLKDLNLKLSAQKAYFDALETEIKLMLIHHRQYHASLLSKLPNNQSENSKKSLVQRDIEKIIMRIAKLDSLQEKLNEKRESNMRQIKILRIKMLRSDIALFDDLEFNVVEPLQKYLKPLDFQLSKKNPFQSCEITDSDFPNAQKICTDFGREFLDFYREIFKGTVLSIQSEFKKISELRSHFLNFSGQVTSTLSGDFMAPEKAEKLLQLCHAYGGRRFIENVDKNYDPFSIFRKTPSPPNFSPKFDGPEFLNVSIPTLYDLKTDKPMPSKRANNPDITSPGPSSLNEGPSSSSTPLRSASLFSRRLTEAETTEAFSPCKKSKFSTKKLL